MEDLARCWVCVGAVDGCVWGSRVNGGSQASRLQSRHGPRYIGLGRGTNISMYPKYNPKHSFSNCSLRVATNAVSIYWGGDGVRVVRCILSNAVSTCGAARSNR